MAYGQKNYGQKLGTGSLAMSIAQVGCFLTAFSNLLERFGEPIDPPALNQYFIDHGSYMREGDGTLDWLAYGSISAYDGRVHVTGSGNGVPPSSNAIVKFVYRSKSSGLMTTHFCLVADRNAGTIVDSWDGAVKSWNVYGGPVEWATYEIATPVVIAPVAPVAAPANNDKFVTVQSGWGLDRIAQAAGFGDHGTPARWANIAQLNGSGDWGAFNRSLHAGQQVRVRPDDPAPTPPPAPVAPTPAPQAAAPVPQPAPPVEDWKGTFKEANGYFRATGTITVTDFDDNETATLKAGQGVRRAGTFVKKDANGDLILYARTKQSVTDNNWFGIPQGKLVPAPDPNQVKPLVNDIKTPTPDDDSDIAHLLLDDLSLGGEAKALARNLPGRTRVVNAVGATEAGIAEGFRSLFKRKKK